MSRKARSGLPLRKLPAAGAPDLATGARFAARGPREAGSVPSAEDLNLAVRLGFRFLVVDISLPDRSAAEALARAWSGQPTCPDLYIKVCVPSECSPDDACGQVPALASLLRDAQPKWLIDLPEVTARRCRWQPGMLADRFREVAPSSPVGWWWPCSVFVPDDPDSPWDTRAARDAAARQQEALSGPNQPDFIAMVWQGVVTLRFSPFRPFSRWTRVRGIHYPDVNDMSSFAEAFSMAAACRLPVLIMDSGPGPLEAALRQAETHCGVLGTFAGETGNPEAIAGYGWSPFLAHADADTANGTAAGLVLLDPEDGTRTPYPETFRWTMVCRRAFQNGLTKGISP